MKKNISIILSLVLLLLVFAGCQSASPDAGQSTPVPQSGTDALPQPDVNAASASSTVTAITKEDAEKIALEHAGFTADQVTRLYSERDLDDRIPHYDVEFHQGGFEYDYEINAENGQILKSEKERD